MVAGTAVTEKTEFISFLKKKKIGPATDIERNKFSVKHLTLLNKNGEIIFEIFHVLELK